MSKKNSIVAELVDSIAVFVDVFLYSWFAMLILGAAHSADGRVPAFSYWVTVALFVVVKWAANPLVRSKSNA